MNVTRLANNHLYCLYVVCFLLCLTQQANMLARAQVPAQAHKHRARANMLAELRKDVSFVKVEPPDAGAKENICTSRDRRFVAFTASAGTQRLYISDIRAGVVYEVRGIPLEHRPFSDLRWSAGSRLVFDRWSQPHHGMHYELDARRKSLVVAFAFPD